MSPVGLQFNSDSSTSRMEAKSGCFSTSNDGDKNGLFGLFDDAEDVADISDRLTASKRHANRIFIVLLLLLLL